MQATPPARTTPDTTPLTEPSTRGALRRWWQTRWARCTGPHRDRGMSTAEYAVGTIAACAFAALLFKVVTSPEVQEALSALVDRALNTSG
jgi:hypothetical protein